MAHSADGITGAVLIKAASNRDENANRNSRQNNQNNQITIKTGDMWAGGQQQQKRRTICKKQQSSDEASQRIVVAPMMMSLAPDTWFAINSALGSAGFLPLVAKAKRKELVN